MFANAGDARDMGSIPGLGRSPGVENGKPLQYSCLENSMDRGAWRATVHGVAKSWTWLKNWKYISVKGAKMGHWSPPTLPLSCPWKWKWSRSVVSDSLRSHEDQAPPSMGFSRQEYWSGLTFQCPFIQLCRLFTEHSCLDNTGKWRLKCKSPRYVLQPRATFP